MEREVTIADLASKFLAQEAGSAEAGNSWSWSLRPSDPAGIPAGGRGLRSWSAGKKSTQVKREATVAILASECLAQVAVSCQHAQSPPPSSSSRILQSQDRLLRSNLSERSNMNGIIVRFKSV